MSYHEGFRIGRWNRVSIGNHTLKDGHSSPPLIFTSALMAIEANTTSRKSQTMATDTAITKSTAEPPAVSTPSESTCIPTTFPISSNTMLETDSREETIPLQRHSKLGSLQSSQTSSPVPIIRTHVLIAQKDVPVEISKTIKIPYPVQTITELTWSVHSLACHINIPGKHLVIRGQLSPEISYETCSNPGDNQVFCTGIPWQQSIKLEFTYPPLLPFPKEAKVYSFGTGPFTETVTHREQKNHYVDPAFGELRELYIVSSEQITTDRNESTIELRVSATLFIDIFQMQLVPYGHP